MLSKIPVSLSLCNKHLISLFHAVETGDIKSIYEIEHTLTQEEECIACTYALRAHGPAKDILKTFLEKEGFLEFNSKITDKKHFWYFVKKIFIFLFLIFIFWGMGMLTRMFLMPNLSGNLSIFGIWGVIISSSAVYLLLEYWFDE